MAPSMSMRKWAFSACCFLVIINVVYAWDNDDLELFDLVEEVNRNFYEVLGVEKTATSSEIRRAYRKLSLQLHPDKNKEENAELQFRQLVAVYETLKDEEKRKKYELVLTNGLPDWRQPVFYYRRVRKMGLIEMALLLTIILTVGHFLVIWSIYFEKRFEIEEVFKTNKKRTRRTKKARQQAEEEDDTDEELFGELKQVPRPCMTDVLPIKVCRSIAAACMGLPQKYRQIKEEKEEARRLEEQLKIEEEEEEQQRLENAQRLKELQEMRKEKRRQRKELPEYTDEGSTDAPVLYGMLEQHMQQQDTEERGNRKGCAWTDEEIAILSKATAKFPGGTPHRWDKIADVVGRTPREVIEMTQKIKGGIQKAVNTKAQGIDGGIEDGATFKKGKSLETVVISERDDEMMIKQEKNDTLNRQDNKTQSNVRKRQKPAKPGADRTLVADATGGASDNVCAASSGATKASSGAAKASSGAAKASSGAAKASSGAAKASGDTGAEAVWTQNQQKILERALATVPKGTADRWDRIADQIEGKTKEECIVRFKYLAEVVKNRKQQQQQQQQQQ